MPRAPLTPPIRAILVFTKTEGFRHDSIPAAIQAVRDLGARNGFDVTPTEDDTVFSAAGLAPYDAVVFLLTTGDVLNDAEQAAFETWLRAGHGYVGVHSAADTERDWPWYGRLVGAWSSGHPEIQPAVVQVVTPTRRVDGRAAGALEPHRRVVRLPHEPARERRPRAAHARREHATCRATGRWAPITRSRGSTSSTAAAPGTRRAATRPSRTRSRSSSATCSAGSSTRSPQGTRRPAAAAASSAGHPATLTLDRAQSRAISRTPAASSTARPARRASSCARRSSGCASAKEHRRPARAAALPPGRWVVRVLRRRRATRPTASSATIRVRSSLQRVEVRLEVGRQRRVDVDALARERMRRTRAAPRAGTAGRARGR